MEKTIKLQPGQQVIIQADEVKPEKEFVRLFAEWAEKRLQQTNERTFTLALGHLVGIPDTAAVKIANERYPGDPITVDEFRSWVMIQLSDFFGEVIGVK